MNLIAWKAELLFGEDNMLQIQLIFLSQCLYCYTHYVPIYVCIVLSITLHMEHFENYRPRCMYVYACPSDSFNWGIVFCERTPYQCTCMLLLNSCHSNVATDILIPVLLSGPARIFLEVFKV